MKTLRSLALGVSIGAAVGVALIALFAPSSGRTFRAQLRQGFDDTMDQARLASAERQRELEADFAAKLNRTAPSLRETV